MHSFCCANLYGMFARVTHPTKRKADDLQAEMSLEAKERGPEVSYQLALLITGVALAYW